MTDRQQPRRMFRYADSYLTVDPKLAQAIGLDEAIVLTRISYLLHLSRGKNGHTDETGTTWVWNSYDEWRGEHFPFFTKSHITEVIRRLEREGLLMSRQRTSHDRRKLYTIDYAAVDERVRNASHSVGAEPGLDQGAAPSNAEGREQADEAMTAPEPTRGTASANAGKPLHQAKETMALNREKPSLQGRESTPPCEGNSRLQGLDTPRCYRDTIQQTTQQNTRQDGTATRQRMLRGFQVSERVAGYV